MTQDAGPAVTVGIPTYHRPEGLATALRSVLRAPAEVLAQVQVVVSDNSTDEASAAVFDELTADFPGVATYHRNVPGVGMVGNFNRCIELATGTYVLVLHDDDYLRPDGTATLVEQARRRDDAALVFGVDVVDARGRTRQERTVDAEQVLAPEVAVRRLLTNSSFIRFPAMVVRRSTYRDLGTFDASFGGACDLDMWTRIAMVHGITLVPGTLAAYVVHPDADTESTFTPSTIASVSRVFDRVRDSGLLSNEEVRRCQADFLHQFALGGAVRAVRSRRFAEARRRVELLDRPEVREHGPSLKWAVVRGALRLATMPVPPTTTS